MRFRKRIPIRAVGAFALAAILSMSAVLVAHADTADDLERAERRLEELKDEIADREAAIDELQSQLNALAARIETASSEIERTRQQVADVQARVKAGERAYAVLRDRLSERAAEAFVHGPGESLGFLLGAGSMSDLSDRIEYLDAVAQSDADLANEVQNTLYELESARADLEAMLAGQRSALDGLEQDRADLEAKFAEQRDSLDEAEALRAEADALVSELDEQLQQELAPPAPPPSSGGSGDGIPGPLHACPVRGPHAYADTFGQQHVHPGWTHVHQGNDISAPYGTPIVAPFGGTATTSSDDTAGLYVTVRGTEGFVQMLHMSAFGKAGSVQTGDVVGYIGETGLASGPHTHFEWHPGGGAAADPYPQLNEVC